MSTKKERTHLDRCETRVFLLRQGMTGMEFCERYEINHYTFQSWMCGNRQMPQVDAKIKSIVEACGYPIRLLTNPDQRLQIEAATA